MTIASMTGFARAEGHDGDLAWIWEVRSVNGRGLDLRCRTPAGWDALDLAARRAAQARFRRGNVSMTLTVVRTDRPSAVRVDRRVLHQLLALHGEMAALGLVDRTPPRLDMLLQAPGVIDRGDDEALEDPSVRERRQDLVRISLEEALDRLDSARREEGRRLDDVLAGHLDQIAGLCQRVAGHPARTPEAVRARLAEQMGAVLNAVPQLPEDRLIQEAALIAARADIREELDRLQAHVGQARDLLRESGAIGRRLDFLSQEFNREANTLCSKSADVELTRLGLELKASIEQFREQVQNVE